VADIISFAERKLQRDKGAYPIVKKEVEGEVIECVNVDSLTSEQRSKYFSSV
jgi:hypothetical protein